MIKKMHLMAETAMENNQMVQAPSSAVLSDEQRVVLLVHRACNEGDPTHDLSDWLNSNPIK